MKGIGIIKTAHYLATRLNSNVEVCRHVEGLTPDWIIQKTGIQQRYHQQPFETARMMATLVAEDLMNNVDMSGLGLIIVASFSQDYTFPPLSAYVHKRLRAWPDCQVIDINVNCVGLITGTTIAAERMRADLRIKYALVIGVEVLSKYVDPADKFTAPFFSDGASGVLLGRVGAGRGLLSSRFCTDSSVYEEVKLESGGHIYQNGKTTWAQAITNVPYVMKELVHSVYLAMKDIDFFIFHQANRVLIDYIMDKHRIPREKTYTNVERIGNTGAASIGIALDEAVKQGLIKKDMLLMLVGVGAGFNFGANLWRI